MRGARTPLGILTVEGRLPTQPEQGRICAELSRADTFAHHCWARSQLLSP